MISEETHDAFYSGRRSEQFPLAANDVVTVKQGTKGEARAWVISIEAEGPPATYRVEYEDGSDEIVSLPFLVLE